MSFNILKLKKNSEEQKVFDEQTVDHLIVGFSPYSLFLECHNICGQTEDIPTKTLLIDSYERTISENLELADCIQYPWIFNNDVDSSGNAEVKFYKDGEFRSFTGRHKIQNCHPYLLKFKNSREAWSWKTWWENCDESFKKLMMESSLLTQVKSLTFVENMWRVITVDRKIINAKTLTWNLSPESFLKLFQYEKQYPEKFLKYCSSFKSLSFLSLKIKIDFNFKETEAGCLIPMTMGTDEGYFLLNRLSQDQISMVAVIEESEMSEETVSAKLKLMKKQINKIFSIQDKNIEEEKVVLLPMYAFYMEEKIDVVNFIQNKSIFQFDPLFSTDVTIVAEIEKNSRAINGNKGSFELHENIQESTLSNFDA